MKKVLIIYYKQYSATSTIRLGGLIKYLPEFGWEPIILTNRESPELSEFNVITVPFQDDEYKKKLPKASHKIDGNNIVISTIYYFYSAIFLYPDNQKDWHIPALQAIENLLENETIDAVISSYPPVTPHLIAKTIKEKYDLNWIADMRDLWTQYNYYQFKNFLPRKLREKRLESRTLPDADAVTIVSKPLADKLKKQHDLNNVYVIPNGFDPDKSYLNTNLSKKFTITYAGGLMGGIRDPILLFDAVSQLSSENKIDIGEFQIKFYVMPGDFDFLKNSVKKFSLEEIVRINGLIDRDEVLKKESESQLLLLVRWDNPDELGVVPGKIFEYLASNRPILSIGSSGGVVAEILAETKAGINSNDINDIKNFITKSYLEYKKYGYVKYEGVPNNINKYSHKEMAKKFADILNNI